MVRMRLSLFLVILAFCLSPPATAQEAHTLAGPERNLARLLRELGKPLPDSTRADLSSRFADSLSSILMLRESFTHPFDSLRTLGKIASPDGRLRLWVWNIAFSDGHLRYYGFVQHLDNNRIRLTRLTDASDTLSDPEYCVVPPESWYGCLYYRIIPTGEKAGKRSYTLLGWDGYSPVITQKIIEVMTVEKDGSIRFGARLFNGYLDGERTRILFRYSGQSTMLLKAERRKVGVKGPWNERKRNFDTVMKETEVILFDRLIPLDPQLEGLHQHYVPSSDQFDGFILENHKWIFVKDLNPVPAR